jgi:hypothetical protein
MKWNFISRLFDFYDARADAAREQDLAARAGADWPTFQREITQRGAAMTPEQAREVVDKYEKIYYTDEERDWERHQDLQAARLVIDRAVTDAATLPPDNSDRADVEPTAAEEAQAAEEIWDWEHSPDNPANYPD